MHYLFINTFYYVLFIAVITSSFILPVHIRICPYLHTSEIHASFLIDTYFYYSCTL